MKFLSVLLTKNFFLTFVVIDLAGVMGFVNKYLFKDMTYLTFLVIACILDLVTGITKVWKTQGIKAITSKGLRDTIVKIIEYGSFLIITHVITHYEVDGKASTTFLWVNKIAYEFLILVECKSVYENLMIINPKLDLFSAVLAKASSFIKVKKDGITNKND